MSNNIYGFNLYGRHDTSELNKNIYIYGSIVTFENYKEIEYLSKFYKKHNSNIHKSEKDLLRNEKVLIDVIMYPQQYNSNFITAWKDYLAWVYSTFQNDKLRFYLVLENFTKSVSLNTSQEFKELSNNPDFLNHWLNYADLSADDMEVLNFLKKNDLCSRCHILYQSIALLFEKQHDFHKANLMFLEGLDLPKIDNVGKLKELYNQFETRMENRINREVQSSCHNSEAINKHIHEQLEKLEKERNTFVINNNGKRLKNENLFQENSHGTRQLVSNFVIKKRKIHFISELSERNNINSFYGEVPVFIDDNYRKNTQTKGTQLVEIYSILFKFLIDKDTNFKRKNDMFIESLKEDFNKKPISWINGLRIVNSKISNDIVELDFEKFKNIKNNNFLLPQPNEKVIENKILKEDNDEKEIEKIEKQRLDQIFHNLQKENDEKMKIQEIEKKKQKIEEHNNIQMVPMTSKTFEKLDNNKNGEQEKVRYVTIDNPSKEKPVVMFVEINKLVLKGESIKCKYHPTIQNLRIHHYEEQLKEKQRQENRRKTRIIRVDEDGDHFMSSEVESSDSSNNLSKNSFVSQKTSQKNLNLFQSSMSEDELCNKILEIDEKFQQGKISQQEKNKYVDFLEKKVVNMKHENEKDQEIRAFSIKASEQTSNYVLTQQPTLQSFNPFLQNLPSKNSKTLQQPHVHPQNKDLLSLNNYLKPQVLLELPNSYMKKKNEDTHSVSRSLDFTNAKILDSVMKNPMGNFTHIYKEETGVKTIDKYNELIFPSPKNIKNYSFGYEDPSIVSEKKRQDEFLMKSFEDQNNTPVLMKITENPFKPSEIKNTKLSFMNMNMNNMNTCNNLPNFNTEEVDKENNFIHKKESMERIFGDILNTNYNADLAVGLSTIIEKNSRDFSNEL
jgi:hypothetical protein